MNREWNPLEPETKPLDRVTAFGVELRVGDRVRLWPQKSADIMDMALKGKVAVVEAIEQDFEDQVHLAVVLEDDPGRDLRMLRQAGQVASVRVDMFAHARVRIIWRYSSSVRVNTRKVSSSYISVASKKLPV